jgi:hypothetical protein
MKHLWLTALLDISESLRARWFLLYTTVFGGIIVLLFIFGLTEYRIMGFTGLSRLLVTYIQLCVAILPIFVLISTVRSVAGDKEAGVFEYLLSLPAARVGWVEERNPPLWNGGLQRSSYPPTLAPQKRRLHMATLASTRSVWEGIPKRSLGTRKTEFGNQSKRYTLVKGILFRMAKKISLLRAKVASMINVVCPLFSPIK